MDGTASHTLWILKGAAALANHPSALKRARQNEERRQRNKTVKTRVKNVVKRVRQAVETQAEDSAEIFTAAQATIAKAAKKRVLHRRTAARKISRLAKRIQSAATRK
jgi:small subunit ribosomal protein S20